VDDSELDNDVEVVEVDMEVKVEADAGADTVVLDEDGVSFELKK
jgi:hypothetical protein